MNRRDPDCRDEFGHCSTDRVTVWCGHARPAHVCGRHARYGLSVATYARPEVRGLLRGAEGLTAEPARG